VPAGLLLALLPLAAPAAEPGGRPLGWEPRSPSLEGQPPGAVLQRVPDPDTDVIRWHSTRPSVAAVATLADGRRLVRLDGFGRKVEFELIEALAGTAAVVLDLRHNRGGDLGRMLRAAGRFTGPVPEALRLVRGDRVAALAIPAPAGAVWRGRLAVLVGAGTISSGEVLAALLRRHAGAILLGERTRGKDHVLRIEPLNQDWRALIPDGRIEVPGEVLAGGLVPDGPIPEPLAAGFPTN
jgi:hypothetical protein